MPEEAKEYEQGKRGDGQIIKFHLFVSIDWLTVLLLLLVVLDSPPEAIFMVGLPASGKTTFA